MNPSEVLRIVDTIHRDKNIDKEIVFEGIEAALVSAAKKHFGEDQEIVVQIDRTDGSITGTRNGAPMDPTEMAERIGAQTAKQVMIQRIREAERDALYEEYDELRDQLVTGVIQRYEGGTAAVSLGNTEAILPKSEQIPGETHHNNERVRHRLRGPQAGLARQDHPQPNSPFPGRALVRAGDPGNQRRRD